MNESLRSQLVKASYNFLARHGLPSHYDTIAQVVWNERGVDLRDLPLYSPVRQKLVKQLYDAIIRHPEMFERTSRPGVYWLKGKRPERTYPELE